MKIIISGGAGYIGSHTAVEALRAGHEVLIIDSLVESTKDVLEGIHKATGKGFLFQEVSLLNHYLDVYEILPTEFIIQADVWVHFAAYKNAPGSVQKPQKYYRNNIGSLLTALEICNYIGIENFIFSSSATVYGEPQFLPITERHPTGKTNTPYGTTKVMCEWILEDVTKSSKMKSVALRYFNPAGADVSLEIGENPVGVPDNLVPIMTQSAAGIIDKLTITGTDFPTADGSAIRDFIHVTDLAQAHLAALEWLDKQEAKTFDYFNIGTGKGTSVLEMVNAFNTSIAPGALKYELGPRRAGDVAEVWCDVTKTKEVLGWKSKLNIESILKSAWDWECKIRGLI